MLVAIRDDAGALLGLEFDPDLHPKGEGGRFVPTDNKQPATTETRMDGAASMTLEQQARDWSASLSPAEQEAVLGYTSRGDYKEMNAIARGDQEPTAAQQAQMTALDSAISKAGDLPETATVYRGVDMGPVASPALGESRPDTEQRTRDMIGSWAQDSFPVGSEVTLGGYQSTSFDVQPALDAALTQNSPGVVFEIEAHSGAYLGEGVGQVTRFEDEHELLLARDTAYEVTGVEPSATFEKLNGDTVERTVVQLRQK